jgi:putative salt-induced outer membrane protein
MFTARHDPFQGLDLRFNFDPGVAAYALTNPKHRLWFEAGYDLQFDSRTDDAILAKDENGFIVLDDEGNTSRAEDKTLLNHAVRLYAGYSNNLSEKVSFNTGFEYLQSVVRAKRFRFVFDAGISTQLAERFSFVTTFTLRYENEPLPDVQKLDTITAVSLAYRFL